MYSADQLHYLNAMGIPAWESRDAVVAAVNDAPVIATPQAVDNVSHSSFAKWLEAQFLQQLAGKTEPIFTLGLAGSSLLVLADCLAATPPPQPFYGIAGNMLDGMLNGIKQNRKTCQIGALAGAGAVAGERVQSWVTKHNAQVILFLTAPQAAAGFAQFLPSQLPAKVPEKTEFEIAGARCVVSYHPDYLLSNIALKPLAWEHWKQTLRLLSQYGVS